MMLVGEKIKNKVYGTVYYKNITTVLRNSNAAPPFQYINKCDAPLGLYADWYGIQVLDRYSRHRQERLLAQ